VDKKECFRRKKDQLSGIKFMGKVKIPTSFKPNDELEKALEEFEDYINLGIKPQKPTDEEPVSRSKKSMGGLIKGKPKLAKKGWK
jgi:hypothetical protein